MLSTTRLFHPLSGAELKETLVNEFKNRLDECELLQPHLTYPKVTYKMELTIESYPMDYPVVVRNQRTIGEAPEGATAKETKLVYSRSLGETQETAPDKIREENDLPTLRAERQPETGNHIDVEQSPRKVTVGKGAKPRGAKAATVPTPEEGSRRDAEDPLVDDEGNPVKVNRV